jgi:hypothetical protein
MMCDICIYGTRTIFIPLLKEHITFVRFQREWLEKRQYSTQVKKKYLIAIWILKRKYIFRINLHNNYDLYLRYEVTSKQLLIDRVPVYVHQTVR